MPPDHWKRKTPGKVRAGGKVEIFLLTVFRCFWKLILLRFHPETPSPLAGEGRGEGKLKRKSEIPNRYHPHLSLLHRRGREKVGFPDVNYLVFFLTIRQRFCWLSRMLYLCLIRKKREAIDHFCANWRRVSLIMRLWQKLTKLSEGSAAALEMCDV